MPIKILLADKSITIQKVVEMLFSGKEYEVICVSDGETALKEATRVVPDVVLADIDLPRLDGYSFSARIRQTRALAKTPVILMMSRDDVFDQAKGNQAVIFDHIAKPFESQELISKVKKAASAAPPQTAAAASQPAAAKPASAPPRPAPAAPAPAAPKPKAAAPADIFDIIEEAPSQADLKRAAEPDEDEGIYEVEPVVEVEEDEELPRDTGKALPVGRQAVEEMREGLGLSGKGGKADEEIVSFESLDLAARSAQEYAPPKRAAEPQAREWKPPVSTPEPARTQAQAAAISESDLWNMAEGIVSRIAKETFEKMPPAQAASSLPGQVPQISEEMLRPLIEQSVAKVVKDVARDIIEKVAWEVVPDLAANMIRAEIERLKAEM